MDEKKAKVLINLLKSSSSDEVCKGLREVKKRLIQNRNNLEIFRELGLVSIAVDLVQKPNEEILNLSLSILSVCCAYDGTREEVYENGGAKHLMTVFRCAKSESLQQRTCRTIANLAQYRPGCSALHKLGVVQLIINLLKEAEQDDAKLSAIRACRLLGSTGEHCQKIVMSNGVLLLCEVGLKNTSEIPCNSELLKASVKSIAHFSRVAHPSCINQLMQGTDNMVYVTRHHETSDPELYDSILRTVLNIVRACFDSKYRRKHSLDARILDRLCTARAPSILVAELKNRRVKDIEQESLILALCKFCEGSNECLNYTAESFTDAPTFLGRAWMQLMECGGVALLVSLLTTYRSHAKLRPSLLRALLGIEHNYSFKEKVLKHCLAANILPQLADQFDEAMEEYQKVKRKPLEGCCVHILSSHCDKDIKNGNEKQQEAPSKEYKVSVKGGENQEQASSNKSSRDMEDEMEFSSKEEEEREISMKSSSDTARGHLPLPYNITSPSYQHMKTLVSGFSESEEDPWDVLQLRNPLKLSSGIQKPHSPTCSSPRSPYSSGYGSGSGNCSPLNTKDSSCSVTGVPPWSWDSPTTSSNPSPSNSPSYSPQHVSSPQPSNSPIRVPSDWEYEEEDEKQLEESGRFSPVIPEEGRNEQDEKEDSQGDQIFSRLMSSADTSVSNNVGESSKGHVLADSNDALIEKALEATTGILKDLKCVRENSKRVRSPVEANPSVISFPDSKKIKLIESEQSQEDVQDTKDKTETDDMRKSQNDSLEESSGCSEKLKTSFVEMNKIKFRVGKRGSAKRQISFQRLDSAVTSDTSSGNPTKDKDWPQRRHSTTLMPDNPYEGLSKDEQRWLQVLEWLVRLIGQIAMVKEAITSVCREFVPRLMTYLTQAQVVHLGGTRMLTTVAKNSLSIQPLLDTLFIPYVSVELGEAYDPEAKRHCWECIKLADGARSFLQQMTYFFGHAHQYGSCEVSSRLHPDRECSIREACVMALPHVMRCPRLLHNFLVRHPGLDILLQVLLSERQPDDASFMYATAGLAALASTLQVDYHMEPQRCPICVQRGESRSNVEEREELKSSPQKGSGSRRSSLCGESSSESHLKMFECHREIEDCLWQQDKNKDVTFVADDKGEVQVNRDYLSQTNEVMRSMLKGSFSESTTNKVVVKGMEKPWLEKLIHFLYKCNCSVMHKGDIETYIQLIFISEMYFLPNLRDFAASKVVACINSGEDILKIYESGVGRVDPDIMIQALSTVIGKPMKTWKRARWLKTLFTSRHLEDITHNLSQIIKYPLDINKIVCNCDMSQSLYMVSESAYRKLH